METEEILEVLLESPEVPNIISLANEILANERETRLRFYDFIDEDSKA